MEVVSALAGAITSLVFFWLMTFITEDLIISFITTFFLAFSYMQWLVCTTPKIYPLSGLFLVLSFYFLLKVSAGSKKFIFALAAAHALAMVAHNTNIFFSIPIICGLLMGKQPLGEKTKNILVYFSIFSITTAVISGILIGLNLPGISFNDILPNIKQQLELSSGYVKHAHEMVEQIALSMYPGCFLSFIVCEKALQPFLTLLVFINFLFSMIYAKEIPSHARCIFLCLIWGITTFCIFMSRLYGNLNMHVPIFPFWILMGIIFSVMAKKISIAPFEKVIRGLIIIIFILFLAIFSYTNFEKEFLPRHLGTTDCYFLPVKHYEKFLSPEDTVISDRLFFLYFSYFTKCQVLVPDSDIRKFPLWKAIIDAQLQAGKRVFFHKNSQTRGAYSATEAAEAQFISPSDCAEAQEKLSRAFNLVPYKSFPPDDYLFILRPLGAPL